MAITAIEQPNGLGVTPYAAWSFNQRIVAPDGVVGTDSNVSTGLDSNKFASAKTLLIAAGPPNFPGVAGGGLGGEFGLTPIGLVQDFSLQQERALSEIYEVGSRQTYYMIGRSTRRLSLSGIVYSGASLLRAIYQNGISEFPVSDRPEDRPAFDENELLFSNLDSRFFEGATGIYIRIETLADAIDVDPTFNSPTQIGGMYLEECYVRAHGISTNANNTVVAENTVITFARVVPVDTEPRGSLEGSVAGIAGPAAGTAGL